MRKLGQITPVDIIICLAMFTHFLVWGIWKGGGGYQPPHVDQSVRTFLDRPLVLLTVWNPVF